MNTHMETLAVDGMLSAHGDALLHGSLQGYSFVPGVYLKQRLFAWHEPSFYGTELAVRQVEDEEIVILPAEWVVPFFADPGFSAGHIRWELRDRLADLAELAPLLHDCVENKMFIPSFAAYRAGKLHWIWDEKLLDERARAAVARACADEGFAEGLRAAFSAAVFHRHYGTEAAAADLHRDYPLLFTRDAAALAGMDEAAWLVAVGWKADTAPFRPVLQLLEPDEERDEWRLQLMLQDKTDEAALTPIRLAGDGTAPGGWPEAWDAHVRERAAGWLDRLRALLPAERLAGDDGERAGDGAVRSAGESPGSGAGASGGVGGSGGSATAGDTDERADGNGGNAASEGAVRGTEELTGSGVDVLDKPLTDEAAWRFLTEDSRRLLEAGWLVLLPAWWEAASRRRPRLRAKVRSGAGSGGRSLFGLDAIVDFDWRVAIGDLSLTEEEFAELAARGERLVRFKGTWIPLAPALIAQIRKAMAGMDRTQGLSFQDVLQLHLLSGGDDGADGGAEAAPDDDSGRIRLEVELNGHLRRLIGQLGQQGEWPKLEAPEGLRAELRAYQRDGYSWLAFLRQFGLGACLADDMGLGKTVQLIAYLLHLKETGGSASAPALIVCPTSVLGNWQKELERFAPTLRVLLHYGGSRREGEAFAAQAGGTDVVLTSYATAALDQETLASLTWAAVCLDEAQNIKNPQTRQSAAVRALPARHRIVLTGTPIENRLSELWSIYDFMAPGYLGTAHAFQHRFASAIEKDRDAERTADLQKLVKPFMLRRKKKDPAIRLDLPDKNEMKTYVPLTAEQGALYEQTVKELLERMQKLEGIERKGAILAALTQLKQLCDHPALLTKEPLPDLAAERDAAALAERLAGRSSKLERLLAMVKELREEGDRCLIFTQYIGMGQMLQQVLGHELGEPVLYLNGSTSKTARDRMIAQFQAEPQPGEAAPGVFILSLKAGGVGLNLTAANHVFHFDRWWNPAVENQATDRAYRMGQTRDVQVHKFIALGTLEERIDEMLESKMRLSEDVISASEGWITELSTDELKELFTLRRDFVGG